MRIRVPRKPADAYQHGNLRHALIQAGLRLLSEGGVDKLSLRAAAQLAGVSHTAPYRHFADKDALVAAIAEEGFSLFTRHLRDAVAACAAPRVTDRLRAMATGYVAFALAHPAYLRVMFGGKVANPPPELRAAGAQAYAVLRDLVAEGVQTGELRAEDPDTLALACWSVAHGLSMLLLGGGVPEPFCHGDHPAQLTAALTRLLETGIATKVDRSSQDT